MAFLIGGANSAADTGYNVDNSIRFNGPDNSNLTQTSSGTPTNRRKCTVSFWIKHDCKSGNQCLIQGTDDSGANSYFQFELTDVGIDIQLRDGSGATYIRRGTKGKRIFRDPSAWYHFVVRFDSTEGSAGDRFRVYINGTQDPLGGSDDTGTVDSNYDFVLTKDSMPIAVGSNVAGGGDWSGYMAELVCIDGDSLAPTSFGEFDEDSPTIWKPIDVSGLTFGTNGFYCDFEDSGDLGDDESGNTNDFTENNLAAADQAVDTPTNNFATLNPLIFNAEAPTFSEGNCKFVATAGSNFEKTTGTIAVSTGKWYWEAKMAATLTAHFVGVQTTNAAYDADEPMYVAGTTTFKNNDGGEIRTGASETTADYGTFDATEIFGIALDMTAGSYGQFTIYKDNSAIASNIDLSSTTGDGFITPFVAGYSSTIAVNFGGCPGFAITSAAADANGYGTFEFAPPSGYYALCTKNLAKYG